MGATITCNKLAASFVDANAKTWYTLYEETYEKNCYPHRPQWSCIYFGPLEGAIEKIFKYSSSCAGGMLRSRNGYIKPENYIAAWLRELKNPVAHTPLDVSLEIGSGFYTPIPQDQAQATLELLRGMGRDDIAKTLEEGRRQVLSMANDADIVATLFGNRSTLSPWRVIGHPPLHGQRDSALGYSPAKAKTTLDDNIPKLRKISAKREGLLVLHPDGSWRYGGWDYSVTAHFICSIWRLELSHPGSYKKAIEQLDQAIKSASVIPQGTKVVVDTTVEYESKWARENVEKLKERIPVTTTPTGFEFEAPTADDLCWLTTSLPTANTQWVMVATAEATAQDTQLALELSQ